MRHKLLIVLIVFINFSLFSSQEISKIELHHSNPIILFKSLDIFFEPIKNNKKGKVRIIVEKDKDEKYFSKISKEKFREICNAVYKINYDTIAVKSNLIDGSSTDIILFDNLNNQKSYFATGLRKESQDDKFQKDFWSATKLILKAARLKMVDLIDYR